MKLKVNIKNKLIIFGTGLLAFLVTSCFSPTMDKGVMGDADNPTGGFSFTLVNDTGGAIKAVMLDEYECGDMAPGDSCRSVYKYRPWDVVVSYTTGGERGIGESFEKKASVETEPGSSFTHSLKMESDYVAVWVNNNSARIVDAAGINFTGTGAPSGIDQFEAVSEDIKVYENMAVDTSTQVFSTTLSSSLSQNQNTIIPGTVTVNYEALDQALELDAVMVTSEDLNQNINIEGEVLTPEGLVISQNLAIPEHSKVIGGTVYLYMEGIGHELTKDDSGGSLYTSSGYVKADPVPTVEYLTGALSLTLNVDPAGKAVTANYEYSTKNITRTLAHKNIKPGTLIIYKGATQIGEDSAGDGTIIDSGGGEITGTGTVDYAEGTVSFMLNDFSETDNITCSYEYYAKTITMDIGDDIKSGSLVVKVNGTAAGTDSDNDDGTGTISGEGISSGTINYSTGALTLELTTHPGYASYNTAVTGDYSYKIAGDDGSGAITSSTGKIDGSAGASNAIDYDTGGIEFALTSDMLNTSVNLRYRYQVPLAKKTTGTQVDVTAPFTVSSGTDVVEGTILLPEGSFLVPASAAFSVDDGSGAIPFTSYSEVIGNSGCAAVSADQIGVPGTVNFTTGEVSFTLFNNFGTNPVVSCIYSHVTAGERLFLGFFKKSETNNITIMDLNGASIEEYWKFDSLGDLIMQNETGSNILELYLYE